MTHEFKTKVIDLGTIPPRVKKQVIFEYIGEMPKIYSLTSSCGCSAPYRVGNNIVVDYVPDNIPIHLQHIGFYTTEKTVTVYFSANNIQTLMFKAKIEK
jgi:hypothetical protein